MDEDLRRVASGGLSGSVRVALGELTDRNLFGPARQATFSPVLIPSSGAVKSKDVIDFPVVEERLLCETGSIDVLQLQKDRAVDLENLDLV